MKSEITKHIITKINYTAVFIPLIVILLLMSSPFAYSYETTQSTWTSGSCSMKINPRTGPAFGSAAILTAMDEWNDVDSSCFVFDYTGNTTKQAKYDKINTVCFGTLSNNTIGYSTWWYIPGQKKTVESDIKLRSNYEWTYPALSAVTIHELGHTLGLSHSSDTNAIMYSIYHGQKGLHRDDIDGITYLYPGNDTPHLPNMDGDANNLGDLLFHSKTNGAVAVALMNDGPGCETSALVCPERSADWKIEAIKDFNADATADILWQNNVTSALEIWLMNGTEIIQTTVLSESRSLDWKIRSVADFNADGSADIFWQNARTGGLQVWMINEGMISQVKTIYSSRSLIWRIKAVADFNADGKADILWQNGSSGSIDMWLMDGPSFLQIAPIIKTRFSLNWKLKATKDLNNDGKADLIWQDAKSGAVRVWLMNGCVPYSKLQKATVCSSLNALWQLKAAEDFNGDGKADLLWQYAPTGQINLWLMNGASRTANITICSSVPKEWQIKKLSDVDADGKMDIIWYNSVSGDILLWCMNGSPYNEPFTVELQSPDVTESTSEWMIK